MYTLPPKKSLLGIVLIAFIVTTALSFTQYKKLEFSQVFPKSTTLLTPYDAFEPQISMDIQTNKRTEGIGVSYAALIGNTFLVFSLLVSLYIVFTALNSKRNKST